MRLVLYLSPCKPGLHFMQLIVFQSKRENQNKDESTDKTVEARSRTLCEDEIVERMVSASAMRAVQPAILSSFVGNHLLHSAQPLHQLFRYNPGPAPSFTFCLFPVLVSCFWLRASVSIVCCCLLWVLSLLKVVWSICVSGMLRLLVISDCQNPLIVIWTVIYHIQIATMLCYFNCQMVIVWFEL